MAASSARTDAKVNKVWVHDSKNLTTGHAYYFSQIYSIQIGGESQKETERMQENSSEHEAGKGQATITDAQRDGRNNRYRIPDHSGMHSDKKELLLQMVSISKLYQIFLEDKFSCFPLKGALFLLISAPLTL